jgi:hypothetical protein
LQIYILDSDLKTVFALRAGSVIAIKKCLGANISQPVSKKSFLAITSKNGVERLNMRVDG